MKLKRNTCSNVCLYALEMCEGVQSVYLPLVSNLLSSCKMCFLFFSKTCKTRTLVIENTLKMFFYSPSLNSFMHFNRLFEQRCINIMDRMYEENTKSAIDSMDDEAVVWGIHSSPLTFAYENFMYDIVAHTCSQKNMNKQWYNNLAPDLMPFLKVNDLALYKNIT